MDIGGGSQTTVVLLSDVGGCAAGYHDLLRELATYRRVAAIDRFGTRLSTGLRGPGHPLKAWVGQVEAVVAALDPAPVDLVGHSLGGMVAGALAVERPQRVRKIALVSSVGLARGHPWSWSAALLPGALAVASALSRRCSLAGSEPGSPQPGRPDPDIGANWAVKCRSARGSSTMRYPGSSPAPRATRCTTSIT